MNQDGDGTNRSTADRREGGQGDPSAARQRLRLLVLGPYTACAAFQSAVQMTGNAWDVESVRDASKADPSNVGALLVPCDAVADLAVKRLADSTDAPLILYSMSSTHDEGERSVGSRSIVSLSALSPRDVVATIQSAIERWGHSRAIQSRARDLAEARQSGIELLSAVNHEVRTPLNAILGMAEMLLETDLDPDQGRFAHVIHSSGGELLRVLNQLVDLTRLRAGNVRLSRTEFDLADLVQAAAESESAEIGKRQLVGIRVVIDPGLPRTFIGPEASLGQVLCSLIAYSTRQTTRSEIRVGATGNSVEEDGSIVRFFIEHTGDSVDSDQLAQTFAAFATGDPPISRDHGGVGIGLALAAGLVRAMGGQIWSEDDSRRLCFGVPLQPIYERTHEPGAPEQVVHDIEGPARRSSARHALSETSPEAEADRSPLRLLVADDSEDNRALIETFLANGPYEIRFAVDGSEAVESFRCEDFDVVLMDIQMPVMNGYEATRRIREHERAAGLDPTPIVALTAFAFDEDVALSLESGCDLHFAKPIKKQVLIDLLSKYAGTGANSAS